jgi:plasmid stabilization system protein ParE
VKQYSVIISPEAQEDFERLQDFWIQAAGPDVADRAIATVLKALEVLSIFPHSCRKASTRSFNLVCRELVIPFGSSGYLALFEIQEEHSRVAVLAVKHQRESDYH